MDLNSYVIEHSRRDGTFLDIGANHGQYTIEAARSKKHVIAFEPFPANIVLLRQATEMFPNVTIAPIALSDHTGSTLMYPHGGNPGGHTIMEHVARGTWGHKIGEAIEIPIQTLDEWMKESGIDDLVGMKIDVECAEEFVLRGALETLKKYDLMISLETHQEINMENVKTLIAEAGYRVFKRPGEPAEEMYFDSGYILQK